ncbi:cytochrome c oxidase [Naviculisporaceae sp. PSN 640]
MGAQQSTPSPTPAPVAAPTTAAADKPKPCCVCKDEKAKRDECMLFSKSDNPEKDCKSTIDLYRECMAGYGFKV